VGRTHPSPPSGAYFKVLNAADLEGTVAVFAKDGSVMANENPTATGHEQLRRLFTGIFKALSFGARAHVDWIIEAGDLATAQTHTTGTLTMPETNTTIPGVSRELWVLRKTGSEWRAVAARPTEAGETVEVRGRTSYGDITIRRS
jgi:ketosteroid isomerase-like protein